jgi:hypothetical protein
MKVLVECAPVPQVSGAVYLVRLEAAVHKHVIAALNYSFGTWSPQSSTPQGN